MNFRFELAFKAYYFKFYFYWGINLFYTNIVIILFEVTIWLL